jgi:hypothetical protein
MSDSELTHVETRFGFRFAPDHRLMLKIALPLGEKAWPDWRGHDQEVLRSRFDGPRDGVLFDVRQNGFWRKEWGPRPEAVSAALGIADRHLREAPVLVPLYGHRFMPSVPATPGNPVLSVHQTDIIYYGNDLLDWLAYEFTGGGSRKSPSRRVPYWSDLMDEANED